MSPTTAFYLALLFLGALLAGPIWVAYATKRTLEDIERYQRKRLREMQKERGE